MALTVSVDEIVKTGNNPLLQARAGWGRVSLGEIATVLNGYAFKAELFNKSEGIPLIRIRDVGSAGSDTRYSGEFDPRYLVAPGELLVGMDGDFNCSRWRGEPSLLNQRVCKISLHSNDYDERFLDYVLPGYLKAINGATSSTTVKHLSSRTITEIPLPKPSIDEQKAIVAELEKQFSRLDDAVANLKRVKANLKRYKASVLKDAVEGRLVPTEAEVARREGRSYETGTQLLQRVLQARRSLWQGKGKYMEPDAPDATDLPELPEGWIHATADQLTDENRAITYGVIKLGDAIDGGIPVLRSSDVRHLRIDLEGVKRISPEIAGGYRRTFLRGGEVVMTVRGTLGGIAVVPDECIGFNVSREVAMLAFLEPVQSHVIADFIASMPLQRWLMRRAKGIAYTGINIETLKALPIPLPPVAEQCRIVAEVDRRLSLVRGVESEVGTNLKRAQALRQAVLSKSFAK